jgi:hypothetical protein
MFDGCAAIFRRGDAVSFRAEYGAQHLAVTILVVNYEEIRH